MARHRCRAGCRRRRSRAWRCESVSPFCGPWRHPTTSSTSRFVSREAEPHVRLELRGDDEPASTHGSDSFERVTGAGQGQGSFDADLRVQLAVAVGERVDLVGRHPLRQLLLERWTEPRHHDVCVDDNTGLGDERAASLRARPGGSRRASCRGRSRPPERPSVDATCEVSVRCIVVGDRNDLTKAVCSSTASPTRRSRVHRHGSRSPATQGSLTMVNSISTNFTPVGATSYYLDDTTPPVTQCTGDAFAIGSSGTWFNGNIPCTDPATACTSFLNATRTMYFGSPPRHRHRRRRHRAEQRRRPTARHHLRPLGLAASRFIVRIPSRRRRSAQWTGHGVRGRAVPAVVVTQRCPNPGLLCLHDPNTRSFLVHVSVAPRRRSGWAAARSAAAGTPWPRRPCPAPARAAGGRGPADRPVPLGDVDTGVAAMRPTGIEELDRVLGGGLVGGSVTLLGGEPGIGKSTLMLQALGPHGRPRARGCCSSRPRSRRSRCASAPSGSGALHPDLLIVAETSLPARAHARRRGRARRARGRLDPDRRRPGRARRARIGEPGARVRAPARADRQGPQHPDAAGRPRHQGRCDRRSAHARAHRRHRARVRGRSSSRVADAARARSTGSAPPTSSGLFAMEESGLADVSDPSSLFLADRRTGLPGSVVTAVLEGARPGAGRGAGARHADARAGAAAIVAGPRPEPAHAAARGARRARRPAGRGRGRVRQRRRRHPGHRSRRGPRGRDRRRRGPARAVRSRRTSWPSVRSGSAARCARPRRRPRRLAEAARLGFRYAIVPTSVADAPGLRARSASARCTRRCRPRAWARTRASATRPVESVARAAIVSAVLVPESRICSVSAAIPAEQEDGRPCRQRPDRKRCSPPCGSSRRAARCGKASTASSRRRWARSIVVGDGPDVLGALLRRLPPRRRVHAPAALRAGEDGRGDDPRPRTARRIARANVHLVPDPEHPDARRPAPGTAPPSGSAKQIDAPVITISEELALVAVHRRGLKRTLEPVVRVLSRADQALQILERYKARLDAVSGSLSALEVEDLVTVRDVAHGAAARRDGAAHRRGDRGVRHRARRRRSPDPAAARGADGRGRGRPAPRSPRTTSHAAVDYELHDVMTSLAELDTETLLDLREVAAVLHLPHDAGLDTAVQPRGYRLLHKIPRLPELVADHVVERFAHLQKIMRAGVAGPRRGRRRRRGARPRDQGRPGAPRRDLHPRALRLSWPWLHSRKGRSRPRSSGSRSAVTVASRSRRSTPRPDGLPRSGVVLHPDVMGIRPLFDDLCRRLATHGFAVCAPEPFRVPRGSATRWTPPARMERVKDLEDAVQIGNLERAADWLVVHDDVSEVAVLGFCMGGMYALKAAATGRFDRAVAFYGMIRVPEAWRGPELARAARHRGGRVPDARDLRQPRTRGRRPRTSTRCATAWSDRPDCEIVVYEGADHGFVHDAERPAHRADDAADAWAPRAGVPRRARPSRARERRTALDGVRDSRGARAPRGRGCGSGCGR